MAAWAKRLRRLFESSLTLDQSPCEGETRSCVERLSTYLDQVVTWNAVLDLTAARGEDELVDLFVADALLLDRATSTEAVPLTWLDVGSGAGAPGLVLGALRPSRRLTLIEPRAKRVAFLRSAIGQLRLSRVVVERRRSDSLPDKSYDVAVSRATFAPSEWLAEGTRAARHSVWVLLARGEVPRCDGWRVSRTLEYQWPLTGAERRAVEFVPDGDASSHSSSPTGCTAVQSA